MFIFVLKIKFLIETCTSCTNNKFLKSDNSECINECHDLDPGTYDNYKYYQCSGCSLVIPFC